MPRFFGGHSQPVEVIRARHFGKAPDGVERQIDRIELDVRDRMEQRGQAFGRERRALGQRQMRAQFRPRRAAGQIGRCLKIFVDCY